MSRSDLRSDDESEAAVSGVNDGDVVAGELAALREENERLRKEFARARQSQYRQSAATLFGIGVLVFAAGIVVESARTVLFALGGTGVFLGVLIYFLTPERFISASVGEAVYASLARNEAQVIEELGLEDEWVYVPRDAGSEGSAGAVRLFVPQHADSEVPDGDALDTLFVVTDDGRRQGVAFRPTAAELYADFEQAVTGESSTELSVLVTELRDALVEQFELVESSQVDIHSEGRVVFRIQESTMGRVDQFDHPVMSLLGVGLGQAIGQPVTVEITAIDDVESEFIVTCTWEPADERAVNTD